MFEQVEHQSTPAEKKMLALEVVGAVTACAVIGGALIWFFGYYGTYIRPPEETAREYAQSGPPGRCIGGLRVNVRR